MAERDRGRWLLLVAALLCLPGLWMRVERLEWMEFSGDELMTMVQPYRAAHERFAWHGILTSAGISPPNFLVYILALPVTLTRDPELLVWFVVLWNLAGLACLARALWKLMPPVAALAGIALLASAPGPVLLSRKIWNPDFIPAGTMLIVLLATLGMERPRRWIVVAVFVVCTILTGFHVTTGVLLLCVLAWAGILRVPLERRGIWIGIAAAFVLLSPYLWFLVASRFDDPLGLVHARAGVGESPIGWFASLSRHAQAALAVSTSGGLPARGWSGLVASAFALWTAGASLFVLAHVPSIVRRARQGLEVAGIDKLLVLGAIFEVALLAFLALVRAPVVPHYYAVLIPFPLLAALRLGWRAGSARGGLPFVAATALVVAAHARIFDGFLDEVQEHGPPEGVNYALPYQPRSSVWRAEIERIFDEIDAGHPVARAEQERLRARFEASSEVLLRYDPAGDQPPVAAQGRLDFHAGPEGLEIVGSTSMDMLRLPPFELGGRGRALLRLELWSPKEVAGAILYTNAEHADYTRSLNVALHTLAGENVLYFEIPDPTVQGRLMLRHAAYRWILRAAEVRRVPG
jgi:hypothetical protein